VNLLHLTPYYAPAYAFGGVVRAVEGMAAALAERGHNVTVLTTDALSQTERYLDALDTVENGVRVVRVRNVSVWLRGRANLSTPLSMRRASRELVDGADLIHCHEFRTAENLLVTPIAVRMGKPLVLSPHGTLTTSTGRGAFKGWWDRLLSPAVARRFHTVVGLTAAESDEARGLWERFGAHAQFAVVPNGVDLEAFSYLTGGDTFRARWGISEGEQVCLFLGRLHARKGVDVLIQAFKAANVPNSRLVIAGPDEGMLAGITPMLDERIIVTGYLDNQERLAALAAADVFALPATGEGLSMALLEAMAAALPVIISPGCNLAEVETYRAGRIVEPQVEPLAQALRAMLADENQRARMGKHARELVLERFTWARVAAQLEAVYQQAKV
jgi:glycosyltransferase involved in cell wall biosynthesis